MRIPVISAAGREYRVHRGRLSRANWCRPGDGERTPAPRMVPPGGTDQQELPLRGERDPLQGIRQRVPRRWAMHARRPEAEVGQNLRDDVGLLEEGDEAHRPRAARADQGIHFVHLLDQARPGTLRGRARDFGELQNTMEI